MTLVKEREFDSAKGVESPIDVTEKYKPTEICKNEFTRENN